MLFVGQHPRDHDSFKMSEIQLVYQGVDGTRQELVVGERDAYTTIERCIRKLDGGVRTSVTIIRKSRRVMIGGGGNGGLVIRTTLEDSTSFDAVDPNQPGTTAGLLEIVADGVHGYYEPDYVIPVELVMRAVDEFVARGDLTSSLIWEAP